MPTDLQTRIRELLAAESRDVTTGADLLSRVHRLGRRPPPTRLLLVAAVVSVVLAVSGTIAVVGRGAARHEASQIALVPWKAIDARTDVKSVPGLPADRVPAGTPVCRTGDFRVVASGTQPGPAYFAGWVQTWFVLRSARADTCFLDQVHDLRAGLLDASGRALPNDVLFAGPGRAPFPVLVRPGDLLQGAVTWARTAGRAPDPATLHLALRTGGELAIALGTVRIPAHPETSTTGFQERFRAGMYTGRPTVARPGSLASLTATITGPAAIRAGERLRYAVTLANHTRRTVDLRHCPTVLQQLRSYRGPAAGLRARLNCADAPPAIGPGDSVTFRFELQPADLPAGDALLSWLIFDGRTPVLHQTANVRVVG